MKERSSEYMIKWARAENQSEREKERELRFCIAFESEMDESIISCF